MKTILELIERIEADLDALKAQIVPTPEPPKRWTIADQIREFVAEAKRQGNSRSWVVDRCESELDMTRALAWRRLYDIWPTGMKRVGRGVATHSLDQRILTVKPNPKWKGYKSYERYALYRVGQTVGEFLAAGGERKDLHYDTKKGYITLSED